MLLRLRHSFPRGCTAAATPCDQLSFTACDLQSLGYAEYPVVEVLRTAPAPDEAIMRGNQSIPVHGADGGLAFGPTPDPQDRQMVFDATFYRPVNTVFTGSFLSQAVALPL